MMKHASRAVRTEGQVGRHGGAFDEAEGESWDFLGEDPMWGSPSP